MSILSLTFLLGAAALSNPQNATWERLSRFQRETPSGFAAEVAAADAQGVKGDAHPRCQSPARAKVLVDARWLPPVPPGFCPAFEGWLTNLRPAGVSLVYAAQYGGNPGSYMGHLFLKVRSTKRGPALSVALDVIDQTFGFVALIPEDTGPLVYAAYGLFGGFSGGFVGNDFYQLGFEYQAIESRDLWEYQVALEGREVELLLAELWELMRHGPYKYRFFDGNCAAMLGEMLWAVRPDIKEPPGRGLFTTPHHVVKWLVRHHLIADAKAWPSERAAFLARLSRLSDEETAAVEADFRANQVTPGQNYRYYDALVARFDYEETRTRKPPMPPFSAARSKALSALAHAALPADAQPAPLPASSNPALAHPMTLGLLGLGGRKDGAFIDLELRPAGHDLLDPPAGFSNDMALAFLSGRVRYDGEAKLLRIHEFDLMRMKNLAPFSLLDLAPAWTFRTGVYDPGISRFARGYLGAEIGVGLSMAVGRFGKAWLLPGGATRYALVEKRGDAGPRVEAGFLAELGPLARVVITSEVLAPFEVKARRAPTELVTTFGLAAEPERELTLRLQGVTRKDSPFEANFAVGRFF